MPPIGRQGSDSSVQSVDRAITVLQVLARRGPSTVTELSGEVGLHKSTTFRLLSTLEARGIVEQEESRGRYHLGYGIVQLAAGATRRYDLSVISRGVCQTLAAEVGETVNIVIRDDDAVISIDQVIGSSTITTVNWVGQRSPIHATSAGRVFLASMTTDERDEVLAGPLERFTDYTLTDRAELDAQLTLTSDRGWAFTRDEHELGLSAVAAPIRTLDGSVVAAVSVSGPTFRITDPHEIAGLVKSAAATISERNGYPKPM
ncbi:helix-turn-helix domain-containing protein [Gordonia sp. HNM0687]|uniref:Glycerol operon regulatory protein n=1 Tax=Gordonia mangrovi TaxID=2665643 RepID=A0A6L7GM07_9ACTN|nr:IclR family transcriptional regulator [Gordonia mangrovi]MXP19795.1 helix-turn-helix domain-containing protein [Gordonia mangrovi]UVF79578.1 IclR family transcriptional regulator [Gordonia mangrovi]